MDNSTSRIETLLKLAREEEDVETGPKELKYNDEESIDIPESVLESIPSNGNIALTNSINPGIFYQLCYILNKKFNISFILMILSEETKDLIQHMVPVLKKKETPTYIFEIVAEDEDRTDKFKKSIQEKKLKLFDSYSQIDDSECSKSTIQNSLSEIMPTENLTSTILNESNISDRSSFGGSIKYVCCHVKSRSTHMPSPKRFKLV